MGHTLELNLKQPLRDPDRYYLYDLVFDQVHRQGGLTGYAHGQRPAANAYWLNRNMSLNVPGGRTDFDEICEFGELGAGLYYEFLNLGFPLAASAGSDVPWGNTIGTSRVYAYTGPHFDVDEWFRALKEGHTFVTAGPMMEFTIDGKLPGSSIDAHDGQQLRIHARAYGRLGPPQFLEVVAQGDVVRGLHPDGPHENLELDFAYTVRDSTWLAARCDAAHTSPVYIRVGNRPFWKRSEVATLVARRQHDLDELEELIGKILDPVHLGNWDSPETWQKDAPALRERIAQARSYYRDLLEQSRREGEPSLSRERRPSEGREEAPRSELQSCGSPSPPGRRRKPEATVHVFASRDQATFPSGLPLVRLRRTQLHLHGAWQEASVRTGLAHRGSRLHTDT